MPTEAEDPSSANTYKLTCNECEFETTVEGSIYEVLTVAEEHREKQSEPFAEHTVDFRLTD